MDRATQDTEAAAPDAASAAATGRAVLAQATSRPFGLYPGDAYRIVCGRCDDCAVLRQALWYFAGETIAVPRPGERLAGFARGLRAHADLRRWAASPPPDLLDERAQLVWIGARLVVDDARLAADGGSVAWAGERLDFDVVPKIALNRSYYDRSSVAWLATRPLRLRGERDGGAFVARSIWPADWRLPVSPGDVPASAAPAEPGALRALVRATPDGGARQPFAVLKLVDRAGGGALAGKPVLALMLNGAQGDDDEAHGGHFALVTGRVGDRGEIADWLVGNFYPLDVHSEKGIIAGQTPLDHYLGDLNSGQSWYRPSYLLVAVLDDERPAALVQAALARMFNQYYRRQLAYGHATMNCTGISVDVLRCIGWEVPASGPAGRALALAALPWVAWRERSLRKGRDAFEYLSEDGTRLLPALAFEQAGARMLQLATGSAREAGSPAEAMLREAISSMWFVRMPQIPSSRAFGSWPITGLAEFRRRVPADPAKRTVVPVPARAFPDALRERDLEPLPWTRGQIAVVLLPVLGAAALAALAWLLLAG